MVMLLDAELSKCPHTLIRHLDILVHEYNVHITISVTL